MPFQSKAQQRYMFAQHPRIAQRWAKETPDIKGLPEKIDPSKKEKPMKKKAADGMFFEKQGQSSKGRFFRDLEGRDDGMFLAKSAQMGSVAAQANAPAQAARAQQTESTQKMNIGATGAPMGGAGFGGQGMGGGMYGTGRGMGKKAGASPTDWNSDSGMPTGFHRPTHIQPESLEEGGERFHATESSSIVPEVDRQRHGLIEGGRMARRATSSPQMGKQAMRKLAVNPYYKYPNQEPSGNFLERQGQNYINSMKRLLSGAKEGAKAGPGAAERAVSSVTKSELGSLLATLGAGALLFKGGRGAARRIGKAVRPPPLPPPPKAPTGLRETAADAVSRLKKWITT